MATKNNLQGTKYFIAAGTLAGTVGGWILLSWMNPPGPQTVLRDPALDNLLSQPLPTLAQPIGIIPSEQISSAADPAQPAAQQPLRSVARPSVSAAPASSAPPPPVATTQSSKK
jgi:hypothetical protein